MKICHTCQQTCSDDVEFCPRDGAPHNPVAAVSDRRPAIRDRRYNRRTEDLPL
jgi:hypothetical protein